MFAVVLRIEGRRPSASLYLNILVLQWEGEA